MLMMPHVKAFEGHLKKRYGKITELPGGLKWA